MSPGSRLPPLNALRVFDAVARHRVIAKAAGELAVTPSAVSHQLRTLEGALGVTLFERHKHGLKLTERGEALWPAVRQAFQTIAGAAARIGEAATGGELTVSLPVALSARWLSRHIGEFLADHPQLRLRLVVSNDERDVYSPTVDLCVRYGTGRWPDRVVALLSDVMIFPVCAPAVINGARAVRQPEDLARHPLLCEDDGTEWTRWMLAAKLPSPTGRLVPMGNAHVAIEAALHGQGIALADSLLVRDDLEQGRLVRLFDTRIPAQHAYYLVHRPEAALTPGAASFIAWLHGRIAAP